MLKQGSTTDENVNAEPLKIEAKEDGIWISDPADDLSVPAATRFLRKMGVRGYNEKTLENWIREKRKAPLKLAERSAEEEKDAVLTLQLSKDNMTATMTQEAPFFTKPWPEKKAFMDLLAQKNVVFGINEDAIDKMRKLQICDEPIVVASGTPPQAGEHARIELLVDPDKKPEVDENAEKIDHRSRSAFVNVVPGQQIAVKHPLTPGIDGTSVIGSVVKATPGKDMPFPAGSGLEISEDGLSLSATIAGCLGRKDKKLVIQPELNVSTDVDFGVGNINFTGSVNIKGAVREGFSVVASGDISIKEMVEGAHVESQGNIVVSGGVRGMGKGRILAKGNVTLGFVDQADIQSEGSIFIKNAAFHSQLSAGESIQVLGGQKAQIAGGKIQAGLEVICQTLGSEMGTKTEVFVGIPPALAERSKILQAELKQNKENLKKVDTTLEFLKKLEQTGTLDEAKRTTMVSVTKTKFQLQSSIVNAEKELKEVDEQVELMRSKGVVRVKGVCYPGVTIMIRGVAYAVREPFKFASFVFDDGEIRLRSFDS